MRNPFFYDSTTPKMKKNRDIVITVLVFIWFQMFCEFCSPVFFTVNRAF